MRVLIDGLAGPDHPRGVGRYVERLAGALATRGDLYVGVALAPWQIASRREIEASGVPIVDVRGPLLSDGRVSRHLWHRFRLGQLAREFQADVLHLPDTLPPPKCHVPIVGTIHDVAEFDVPGVYSPIQRRYRRYMVRKMLDVAITVITVSEFSRTRLGRAVTHAPGQVVTIPVAAGLQPDSPVRRPNDAPSGRFILFVGALNRNKNVLRIMAAHSALRRSDISLVLAGPPGNAAGEVASAIAHTKSGVVWLDSPSDDELAWLYGNADALVLPSLYEGFGMPYVEAMVFGLPIIASGFGAPAEVVGDAGVLVDPVDTSAITSAIEYLLDDPSARETLAARGRRRSATFSWEMVASRTADVYAATRDHRTS